jgi:hypothetical protein
MHIKKGEHTLVLDFFSFRSFFFPLDFPEKLEDCETEKVSPSSQSGTTVEAYPGEVGLGRSNPRVADPDATDSDPVDLDVTDPNAPDPDPVVDLDATDPNAADPDPVVDLDATDPNATGPGRTDMDATDAGATGPDTGGLDDVAPDEATDAAAFPSRCGSIIELATW